MEGLDAIVLGDNRNANCEQQAQRRIQQRIELGEPTPAYPLEEANVLELSDGTREQTQSQRERRPGEKPRRNANMN